MEVTDVRIRKINPGSADDSKMRAIVSVTFDNEFVVHDIKVIQGAEKLFIAMPSRKVEDGTYKDITHPIKSGFRNKVQDAVMAKYHQALAEAVQKMPEESPVEDDISVLTTGSEEYAGEEDAETI
jgi:stage V sporulation protein G